MTERSYQTRYKVYTFGAGKIWAGQLLCWYALAQKYWFYTTTY